MCDFVPMVLALCVSERQFEKHGNAETTTKATSGHVVNDPDDNDYSFLSKLTALKRKIFG